MGRPRHRRRSVRGRAVAAVVVLAIASVAYWQQGDDFPAPGAALGSVVPRLAAGAGPATRTITPYRGLGAWVDGFDYGVAYQRGGAAPPINPDVVDDLAGHGVKTLF